MENGAQLAAGGYWLAAAPPNFRDRVVHKITKNLPQVLRGRQVDDLHSIASRYEDSVFRQSGGNLQDYFRTISMKMMRFQQNRQPVPEPASRHPQQARMGHQMRPPDELLANSSAPAMPRTASTLPCTLRPQQVTQAEPSFATPVAPVIQLQPRHPTVMTQVQTQCPVTQEPRPQLMRMNQQQDLRHSYNTHGGQQSNVATTMQIGHLEGQKGKQLGHPQVEKKQQPAADVDWREDMFQKITLLKDAHLSELMEFEQALRERLPHNKTNEQIKSLPKEQSDQYKNAVSIVAKISCVLGFLQLDKSSIPELAKDQFDKWQASLCSLLQFYRGSKAGNKNTGIIQSQNRDDKLPRIVNITEDNSQQKREEQPAAEALPPQSSRNVPAEESPLAQQQNHSDHLAGEAENGEARRVAQVPVAVNLAHVTGGTAPFACQQIPQEDPTDEAVPRLTQNVAPAGNPPAQQQTHPAGVEEAEDDSVKAEAETPVAKTSLSPAALRSLASDMGVNLKRAFRRHTAWDAMEGSSCVWFDDEPSGEISCHKRRKTHGGALLAEIRAACSMLVETEISVSKDDTAGEADGDGTVIELCYNAVSLAPDLRAAIGASEIWTKLLVPADYPESSPVIMGCDGERRKGVPGVVDLAFQRALGLLPEPRSIQGMARAWDCIVRRAVLQFAHRHGGGTFSTRYGHWESCITV